MLSQIFWLVHLLFWISFYFSSHDIEQQFQQDQLGSLRMAPLARRNMWECDAISIHGYLNAFVGLLFTIWKCMVQVSNSGTILSRTAKSDLTVAPWSRRIGYRSNLFGQPHYYIHIFKFFLLVLSFLDSSLPPVIFLMPFIFPPSSTSLPPSRPLPINFCCLVSRTRPLSCQFVCTPLQ
jgi:hypothetical protein